MKRCHIDDGNNEALGIDVASIDVVGPSIEIGVPPVEELLSVTSVVESDSRLNDTFAESNSEVAIIGSTIQPSAIAVYPRNDNVNSLLRNNEDTLLMGSDETVSSENILGVIDARVTSVSDREDERRNVSRAVSEIREYLFQQEVTAIDTIIIAPQQGPPIMTNLRKKVFCYTGIALLCAIGITIFLSYHTTQNSSTTVRSNINDDRASLIPVLSNLSSLPPSKNPSYAPSIRRNSKYHDFFDTFKRITPEHILSNSSTPQHRALLWLAYDDNRTMFIFDTKLFERYALVTLFFATGGGEGYWYKNFNFLSDQDVCDWMAEPVHGYNRINIHSTMMGASCYASEGKSVSEISLRKL